MGPPSLEPSEHNTTHAGRPNVLAGQLFPPPSRQERSRRKREALLMSALALFGEHGYEATSIEEIARRAGVAVGGFYQHFASKQQVLLVLMDLFLAEAAELTEPASRSEPLSTQEIIAGFVRQGLGIDWSYAGAYRAWREVIARDGALRTLNQHIESWVAGQLELLIHALLQTPGARRDVDIPTFSWVLSMLFWRLTESPVEHSDAVITSVTSLIYHGLFTDHPE